MADQHDENTKEFSREELNVWNIEKLRTYLKIRGIDLFGLIRHTLVTWSEMGKQTLSSIERHIECHIFQFLKLQEWFNIVRYLTVITIQQMSGYLFINFRMIPSFGR